MHKLISRVKTIVSVAAGAIRRAASFVVSRVRQAPAVAASAARESAPVVARTAARAWTRALRPFLQGVVSGAAFFALVAGAVAAPVVTVLALSAAALALIGASRLVGALEQREAELSGIRAELAQPALGRVRLVLSVIDVIGRAVVGATYVAAAVITAGLCAASVPFAVFAGLCLALGYAGVRGGGTLAFVAWSVLSGNWLLGVAWLAWRAARKPAVARADESANIVIVAPIVVTEGEDMSTSAGDWLAASATDAETLYAPSVEPVEPVERVALDACGACGKDRCMLVRSNAVPFTTAGEPNGARAAHAVYDMMLCSECYDAECEDNAIAMTGVSLRARGVEFSLNANGLACLPEAEASRREPDKVFWAATGWWRDRKGVNHERRWSCFHSGVVVATVAHDHARKAFRACVGDRLVGVKGSAAMARRLATDTLNDALIARDQHMFDAVAAALSARAG